MDGASSSDVPSPCPRLAGYEFLRRLGGGQWHSTWLARNTQGVWRAVRWTRRAGGHKNRAAAPESPPGESYAGVSRAHPHLLAVDTEGWAEDGDVQYWVTGLADDAGGPFRADRLPDRYTPRTLEWRLQIEGCFPATEVVQLGLQLAGALEHLHEQGQDHGAIRPSNILYVGGLPKLGLPRSTRGGEARAVGATYPSGKRWSYDPPEGPGTSWADLYSLGMVLRVALGREELGSEGHGPGWMRDAPLPVVGAVRPTGLIKILRHACEPRIAARFGSAPAMRRALATRLKAA